MQGCEFLHGSKIREMKVTGSRLTKEMVKHLQTKGNRMVLSNVYQYAWECDVFNLSKSGIISEFEIKISRSDYVADFNKTEKHQILKDAHEKGILNEKMPNHFCYVVPEGLITVDELPDYAGLIYFKGNGWFQSVKKAPKLHSEKMIPEMWENIAMKLYYKTI